ncbi:MAG: BlaI/MecI/CopY family transcriptional regulator [Bacteroides sp.]|nr:BlaI/MecI/CopY family transcriptional regulator [Bacteroides sp.]
MDIDTKHRSLTKSELHLMNLLWDKGEGTVNDLIEMMPEPRPAYTTVLTVMRVLTKKGVVKATQQGKANLYTPLMTREEYTKGFMEETRNTLFKGSFSKLLLFFAERERLAADEVEKIIALLKKNQKGTNNEEETNKN